MQQPVKISKKLEILIEWFVCWLVRFVEYNVVRLDDKMVGVGQAVGLSSVSFTFFFKYVTNTNLLCLRLPKTYAII